MEVRETSQGAACQLISMDYVAHPDFIIQQARAGARECSLLNNSLAGVAAAGPKTTFWELLFLNPFASNHSGK